MTAMPHEVLPVGHPARRSAASAIALALGNGVLFSAFAALSTQVKALQAATPWQDDPYHGMVSFAGFLVPALTFLTALRLVLWRRGAALPRFRVDQLLRAALVNVALVAGTVLTDWVAVALRADRPLWNSTTPWLIGVIGVLTVTSAGCGQTWARARRALPDGPDDGDWLDDLARLVNLVTVRPLDLRRPIALLRRHIVAFATGFSLLAGIGVAGAQAVGEGVTDPVLISTYAVIGTGGFLAFCLVCDAALHIARPQRQVSTWWIAVVAGCAGLPVSAVFRDGIWALLDLPGTVDTSAELALITVGGAGAAFALSLLTARAARRAW
jgi:hypothetical protein